LKTNNVTTNELLQTNELELIMKQFSIATNTFLLNNKLQAI